MIRVGQSIQNSIDHSSSSSFSHEKSWNHHHHHLRMLGKQQPSMVFRKQSFLQQSKSKNLISSTNTSNHSNSHIYSQSDDYLIHSNPSTCNSNKRKKRRKPFSSWEYRKQSTSEDTVSLIHSTSSSSSSMESDQYNHHDNLLPWTIASTTNQSFSTGTTSTQNTSYETIDQNNLGKMSRIWSLACLLNCPRQRNRSEQMSLSSSLHNDDSTFIDNNNQQFLLSNMNEQKINHSSFSTTTVFDFVPFLVEEPKDICDIDTNSFVPFDPNFSDPFTYSTDLFSEFNEGSWNNNDPDNHINDNDNDNNSECSVDEIVKEQHDFAQMLQFWLIQAHKTRQYVDETNGQDTLVMDQQQQLMTVDTNTTTNIGNILEDTNKMDNPDKVVMMETLSECQKESNTTSTTFAILQEDKITVMKEDNNSTDTNESNDPVSLPIGNNDDTNVSTSDNDTSNVEQLQATKQQVTTVNGSYVKGIEEEDEKEVSSIAIQNEKQEAVTKASITEREYRSDLDQGTSHIQNLIMFWNKAEGKRLGKPRGLGPNHESKPRENISSISTSASHKEFVARYTADRTQLCRQPDQELSSLVNNEDWISRLTVSRTRGSEAMPKKNENTDSSIIPLQQTRTTAVGLKMQPNLSVPQKRRENEEEIQFWNPRLFGSVKLMKTVSFCSSCTDENSTFSMKSDSSISWFGTVGLDSTADDGSIQNLSICKRLQKYEAEKDPEDADFEESHQLRSSPLMLDQIDCLVTQLSNDYQQALSGLETARVKNQ